MNFEECHAWLARKRYRHVGPGHEKLVQRLVDMGKAEWLPDRTTRRKVGFKDEYRTFVTRCARAKS